MSQHSPHRHLVPKGMRPRQRAELTAEFPTRRSRGLAEALREAIEQMHALRSSSGDELEDSTLPRASKKKSKN